MWVHFLPRRKSIPLSFYYSRVLHCIQSIKSSINSNFVMWWKCTYTRNLLTDASFSGTCDWHLQRGMWMPVPFRHWVVDFLFACIEGQKLCALLALFYRSSHGKQLFSCFYHSELPDSSHYRSYAIHLLNSGIMLVIATQVRELINSSDHTLSSADKIFCPLCL